MSDTDNTQIPQNPPPSTVSDQGAAKSPGEAKQSNTQEKELLQELVHQAMGLKPKESLSDKPQDPESIEHITKHQIKNMRQVSAVQIDTKEPLTDQFAQIAIKIFFGIKSLFSFGKPKDFCMNNGHECMHCGQKIDPLSAKGMPPK